MLDDDLQTVGEKGNLDVSIGAVFQRMINGAYAEFTFERSKNRFDLQTVGEKDNQDVSLGAMFCVNST